MQVKLRQYRVPSLGIPHRECLMVLSEFLILVFYFHRHVFKP